MGTALAALQRLTRANKTELKLHPRQVNERRAVSLDMTLRRTKPPSKPYDECQWTVTKVLLSAGRLPWCSEVFSGPAGTERHPWPGGVCDKTHARYSNVGSNLCAVPLAKPSLQLPLHHRPFPRLRRDDFRSLVHSHTRTHARTRARTHALCYRRWYFCSRSFRFCISCWSSKDRYLVQACSFLWFKCEKNRGNVHWFHCSKCVYWWC